MPKYPRAPRTRTARSLPRLHGASVRHESAVARPRNRDARRPQAAARDGSCGPRLGVRDVPTALRSRSSRLKLFRPQPELLSLAMMRYGTPGDGLQGPIGRRAALGRTVAFRPRVCGGSRLRSCHKAIAALSHRSGAERGTLSFRSHGSGEAQDSATRERRVAWERPARRSQCLHAILLGATGCEIGTAAWRTSSWASLCG